MKSNKTKLLQAIACASVLAFASHSAQAGKVSDWWKKEQLRAEAERAEANLPDCTDCATVTRVEQEKRRGKKGTKGAILGGLIGGVLGNQVGKGNGNDLATVIGAVGGAVIGHNIEKNQNRKKVWKVTVRDRFGQERHFDYQNKPDWIVGQVVRVNGQNVSNYPSNDSELRVMMPADSYYGWDYNDKDPHVFADSI